MIQQLGLKNLLDLASQGQLTTNSYYYTIDIGRLYQATATNKYNLMSNVYYVASDFDRRNNVTRIIGKYYYCLDLNQLWMFNNLSMWEFIDGDDGTKSSYTNASFSNGNFLFAQSYKVTPYIDEAKTKLSPITTTLQKINGVVFGSLKINGDVTELRESGLITSVPMDLRPLSQKIVYITGAYGGTDPGFIRADLYTSGENQGKLILEFPNNVEYLHNGSYFIYALDDVPAVEITNV